MTPWILSLLATGSAQAQGYSIDFEFVRPGFGAGALPGLATPSIDAPGAIRAGTLVQYERAPVTLFDPIEQVERGAIVANHGGAALGVSVDLTKWLAVDATLPFGWHGGTEIPELAGDGGGLGDIGGTIRLVAPAAGPVTLGLRAGGTLPSGLQLSYLGEESPRLMAGLLAQLEVGKVRVATDLGTTIREDTPTGAGFTQGDELSLTLGGLFAATPRVGVAAVVFGRAGLPSFLQGGAENAVEALIGPQVRPVDALLLDAGVGRGFTEGYGTTDVRLYAQVTWRFVRRPPPEPEIVQVEVPVYIDRIVEVEVPAPAPPPEPGWEEGQLARVVDDQIVIRDMLEFVVDTNTLLEKSRPTLVAVADILKAEPRIGFVVIVGHASIEGSHRHNYDLSESRAQRVYEELLEVGVHPSRLGYRAMGEVETLVEGTDEASLQPNRRVEFRIVRQYPTDDLPEYPKSFPIPWTGELRDAPYRLPPQRVGDPVEEPVPEEVPAPEAPPDPGGGQ